MNKSNLLKLQTQAMNGGSNCQEIIGRLTNVRTLAYHSKLLWDADGNYLGTKVRLEVEGIVKED